MDVVKTFETGMEATLRFIQIVFSTHTPYLLQTLFWMVERRDVRKYNALPLGYGFDLDKGIRDTLGKTL